MELDIWQQAAIGTTGGVGIILALVKTIGVVRKEQEASAQGDASKAQSGATKAQFELLQIQIKACQDEAIEFRAQFKIMDRKIHVQQRTITRMEMLLRQFAGLVQENGIGVPPFMKAELEALIASSADIDTDEPPTRRATD